MKEMQKAFDNYGDFNKNLYYSTKFNSIPSKLELRLSLEDKKEHMEKVLALIDFDKFELEVIMKFWNTKDHSNSKITEDFVFEYLFKSKEKPLIVWISLIWSELHIEFLYNTEDLLVEKWIIDTNHTIRVNFGEEKAPSFKVLSRDNHGFTTEDINTKNFDSLDINLHYNDDFQEVNEIIVDSIPQDKSGLILLHGRPGTGKTTYIKNLIATFSTRKFIFVQNEFVTELLKPGFISFLLKNKNCILIIEDAEKVVVSRDTQESSVVSTILQLTDGLFSDFLNIKVICSFNTELSKIDKALLRKGRMIARYEFKNLTKEKANDLLQDNGYEALNKEMSIAEIYKLNDKSFATLAPKRIGF